MDELFFLPSTPLALPRAYWLNNTLNSQLLLIEPSTPSFTRVKAAMSTAKSNEYDMDIINELYSKSAMILPHRPYTILTSDFRHLRDEDHSAWLGNEEEEWDVDTALREVKYLHFSDWPLPKVFDSLPDLSDTRDS